MPTLQIDVSGSNFCDLFITLKKNVDTVETIDPRYQCSKFFTKHYRKEAWTKFEYYKECQEQAASNEYVSTIHLYFGFADQVLLQRLEKGQIIFTTVLKFYIFGSRVVSYKKPYFGTSRMPLENTANVVISMLNNILVTIKDPKSPK